MLHSEAIRTAPAKHWEYVFFRSGIAVRTSAMNTPKWIPKHSADILELFTEARQLERDLRVLGKKFATNLNLSLPDYYVSDRISCVHFWAANRSQWMVCYRYSVYRAQT